MNKPYKFDVQFYKLKNNTIEMKFLVKIEVRGIATKVPFKNT